jgi:hypothetical protein
MLIWRIVPHGRDRLRALCAGDGEERQWLAAIDYLVEESRALHQQSPPARPFQSGVRVKPSCTRSNCR